MIPSLADSVHTKANLPQFRRTRVLSAIDHRLGLQLSGHRVELLEMWLQRRAKALALQPAEFLHHIFSPGFEEERATMIGLVTNQETSFFRGERQLSLFDSVVLQHLLEGDVSRPIRLWSAACSTGEEALTLAMLVSCRLADDSRPGVDHPRVEIVGSDLCPRAVRVAAGMRYSLDSETRIGQSRSDRFFTLQGGALVVKPASLPTIRYRSHNLIDPVPFGTFDVVVARNVFFYMSARARKVAVAHLVRALRPGGVAVFGANDGIDDPVGFDAIGAHCYRRKDLR